MFKKDFSSKQRKIAILEEVFSINTDNLSEEWINSTYESCLRFNCTPKQYVKFIMTFSNYV